MQFECISCWFAPFQTYMTVFSNADFLLQMYSLRAQVELTLMALWWHHQGSSLRKAIAELMLGWYMMPCFIFSFSSTPWYRPFSTRNDKKVSVTLCCSLTMHLVVWVVKRVATEEKHCDLSVQGNRNHKDLPKSVTHSGLLGETQYGYHCEVVMIWFWQQNYLVGLEKTSRFGF